MFNFCPKCGQQHITFVDKRYFTCKDCDFLYFHNIAAAVAGIVTCNNEILLTQRAKNPGKGKWDLPGGFVDPNESLEQALSRELIEELNLSISDWKYFCSNPNTYNYRDIEYRTEDAMFIAELASKPDLSKEDSEIMSVQWLKIDEMNMEDIAFDSVKLALRKFISSK